MFSEIKRFSKHSMIYAVGNIINRAAAFLLIPLYVHYLSPSEYGTLEMFYVTSTVMQTFLGMMMGHAALRFYFEAKDECDRKTVISTALISSFIFTLAILLLLAKFADLISMSFFQTTAYENFFRLIFIIIMLEMSKEICLAYIRAKEYSLLYILVSTVQLLAQIGLNLYMVVLLKKGVFGILLGNTISISIVWLILTLITLKYCGINFSFSKLKVMFRYCYPLVLASIGMVIVNTSDRFFLKTYSTLGVIGLYALAFRFGMVVQSGLIEPFNTSYGAFRFSIMNNSNAKKIYSRILTYFVYVVVFFSLAIMLFAHDVLKVMSSASFWEAHKIVPLIMMSIILTGVTYIFQTGILLMKKTKYIFNVTIAAAILILLLNWVLIPKFNMYGAAIAVAAANLFICFSTYIISQRLYPVNYDFVRVAKIVLAALFIYICSSLITNETSLSDIIIRTILIMSYPFLLALFRFYESEEIKRLVAFKSYLVPTKFLVLFKGKGVSS